MLRQQCQESQINTPKRVRITIWIGCQPEHHSLFLIAYLLLQKFHQQQSYDCVFVSWKWVGVEVSAAVGHVRVCVHKHLLLTSVGSLSSPASEMAGPFVYYRKTRSRQPQARNHTGVSNSNQTKLVSYVSHYNSALLLGKLTKGQWDFFSWEGVKCLWKLKTKLNHSVHLPNVCSTLKVLFGDWLLLNRQAFSNMLMKVEGIIYCKTWHVNVFGQ